MPPHSGAPFFVRALIRLRMLRGDLGFAGWVAATAVACGFVVSRLV